MVKHADTKKEIAENRENRVCICVFYHQKARKQAAEIQKYEEGPGQHTYGPLGAKSLPGTIASQKNKGLRNRTV